MFGGNNVNKEEQLKIVKISYIISIIFSIIIDYLKVNSFNMNGIISAIKVSTILTFWWGFYFKKGWKIKILNKILYRINLNGTWYGTYESVSANKKDRYEGKIIVRIKQDFLNISIISYTEKYINYSHSEMLKYDEKSDTYGLVYVYSQKENDPFDLESRNGTSELTVINYDDDYKLKGEFWTILGSVGKLDLTRISTIHVDSFEKGKKLYNDLNNK